MKKENPNIIIAELGVKVENLDEKLTRFIGNDFRHLEIKVEKIEDKILWGFVAMISATLLTQILLKFI